jgi:uncharacterized protein (DUF697 family)
MNKKKFPKTVLRTAEQMRESASSAALKSAPADNVIEMVPKSEPVAVVASIAPQPAAPANDVASRQRRRHAVAIVERFANYSAVGGAIPVPLANAAALTALLMRMVQRLSKLYGVPFEKNRTRAVVIGLMGGALPTGFATIATSVVTSFVPGYNLLGLAVSSVTSSAYARSIGQLYIEHFENGAAVSFRSVVLR